MTNLFPYYCLFIAVLLPYFVAGASVYFRLGQFGKVDTHQPREQASRLQGAGERVVSAQYNAWEALGVFIAALYTATVAGVEADTVNQAC